MPRVKKTHVIVEWNTNLSNRRWIRNRRKKIGAYCQDVIAEMLEKNKSMI